MMRLVYALRRWVLEWRDAWTADYVSAAWLEEHRQRTARGVVWRDMPTWTWPVRWPK